MIISPARNEQTSKRTVGNDASARAVLSHSSTCSSVFLRSIYDKTCPRCAIVGKVILLRRKNIRNGASAPEAQAASAIALRLIAKHDLKQAELLDRLYTSVTNKIRVKSTKVVHKERDVEDMMEGF
jgi:hypothetical protein